MDELIKLARNIVFCEGDYFYGPVNLGGTPDGESGLGCSTVVKIKSDLENLVDFYEECGRFFDNPPEYYVVDTDSGKCVGDAFIAPRRQAQCPNYVTVTLKLD